MYGLDPDRERLAGWFDGLRAARTSVINAARPELGRFDLLLDDDGEVHLADETPSIGRLEEPTPDNPLGDQDYIEGWEQGFDEGKRSILRRIREHVLDHELFVADDGTVTTMEVASYLVAWCRSRTEGASETTPLTDDALHAFLDTALPTDAPPETSRPTEEPATPAAHNLLARAQGAWKMAKENIDRRTAIAALTGALLTGTLGWLGLKTLTDTTTPETQSQGTQWVPPTLWDDLTPQVRAALIQIDFTVYAAEQSGTVPQLAQQMASVMLLPGNEQLKKHFVTYVGDTARPEFLPSLVVGLDPACSDVRVRQGILGAVDAVRMTHGTQGVGATLRDGLTAHKTSGVENDPRTVRLLDRLIASLEGL